MYEWANTATQKNRFAHVVVKIEELFNAEPFGRYYLTNDLAEVRKVFGDILRGHLSKCADGVGPLLKALAKAQARFNKDAPCPDGRLNATKQVLCTCVH